MGLMSARYAPAMRPFCAHDALSPNRWCHSAPAVRPVCAHYVPLPEIDWPTLCQRTTRHAPTMPTLCLNLFDDDDDDEDPLYDDDDDDDGDDTDG